ncbi:Coatomer subunit delta [Entamoeba marina]
MIQSVAILSRSGKVIISRQNVPFQRTRLEGLFATFIRLQSSNHGTSFETDGVRFIYQSCEDVYIVMITSLSSNIIEDTEILNAIIASLTHKLTVSSKGISHGMFEALFVIDEFLHWGYAEKVSVSTVKSNLAMKSKEEERYLAELELKKAEVARITKKREEEIQEEKDLRNQVAMLQNMQGVTSFLEETHRDFIPEERPKEQPKPKKQPTRKSTKPKGLQLGKKKQSDVLMEDLMKEDDVVNEPVPTKTQPKQEKRLMLGSALVKVVEDSSISVSAETGAISMNVNGSLSIAVAENVQPEFVLNPLLLTIKPQLHPHINPKLFTERILNVKEGKTFATGNPAIYAKWNYKSTEAELPITFTCWPAETQNGMTLSLSYESENNLKDVVVEIPNIGDVTVVSVDGVVETEETIKWIIGEIEEGGSGSLEIEVNGEGLETSMIFPINVLYDVEHTVSGNEIVEMRDSGNVVEFENEMAINMKYEIIA